jgi:hypothetical protein
MRIVQALEHFPVALLRPVKLRLLLGNVRLEKNVARIHCVLLGLGEELRSSLKVRAFARNDTDVTKDFSPPGPGLAGRNGKELLTRGARLVEAPGSDVQLHLIDG